MTDNSKRILTASSLKRGYANVFAARASIISKLYSLSHMTAYQLTKVTCKGLAELGNGGVEIEPFAVIKWNNKVIFESDPVRIAAATSKENSGSGHETPLQSRSKNVYSFR